MSTEQKERERGSRQARVDEARSASPSPTPTSRTTRRSTHRPPRATGYIAPGAARAELPVLQGENTDPEPSPHCGRDRRRGAVSVELLNYRKDGTEFWNRVRIAPVRDDDGIVDYYVGFQQDITERKRARSSCGNTARLEALFEHSPDLVVVHTPTARIREVNQRCARSWGTTKRGARTVDLGVRPDVRRRGRADPAFRAGADERRRFEGALERRDGTTFPTEVHLIELNVDGEDRSSRSFETSRSERNASRNSNSKTNGSNSSRRSSTHDLRNPLTVARGQLELAREETTRAYRPRSTRLTANGHAPRRRAHAGRDGASPASPVVVDLEQVVQTCWQNVDTTAATLRTPSTAHPRPLVASVNCSRTRPECGRARR